MSGPAQNIHNIYDPLWEHDACGIGAVVNLKGTPSHATVDSALKIVEKLEHRAGKDAAGETGDGVGPWAAPGIMAWACSSSPQTR